MAQLSRKFNQPNTLRADDSGRGVNFRDPQAGDGFQKSDGQTGVFIRAKATYVLYASEDGTSWQRIIEVDPSHETFHEGFTMAWDNYNYITFKSSSANQKIRIVGLDGPIVVDTTDDGIYNPDTVVLSDSTTSK